MGVYDSNGTLYGYAPWESTFAETYEQLVFDRLTGWSRWMKLNEQEPAAYSPATMMLSLFDVDYEYDGETVTVVSRRPKKYIKS